MVLRTVNSVCGKWKSGKTIIIGDTTNLTVDINGFRKKYKREDLKDKDYKWAYSKSKGLLNGDILEGVKEGLDTIFMRNVTHHIPDRIEYFKNLQLFLKPDGFIQQFQEAKPCRWFQTHWWGHNQRWERRDHRVHRPKCKQKKERKKIWAQCIKGRIWLRAFGTMPKYLFGNFRYGRNVIHLFV